MIGTSRLAAFVAAVDGELCSAARAAAAELAEVRWRNPDDARNSFPAGSVDARRVTIALGERHCLVLEVSYELGIALIVFVGPTLATVTTQMTNTRTRR